MTEKWHNWPERKSFKLQSENNISRKNKIEVCCFVSDLTILKNDIELQNSSLGQI